MGAAHKGTSGKLLCWRFSIDFLRADDFGERRNLSKVGRFEKSRIAKIGGKIRRMNFPEVPKILKYAFFIFIFLRMNVGFCEAPPLNLPPPQLPVKAKVGFYLWRLIDISERSESFRAECYLDCTWKDERLAFQGNEEYIILTETAATSKLEEIWWPQLDFVTGGGLGLQ